MIYPGTLFLTRSDVVSLLSFEEYVPVVEQAFGAHAEGNSLQPGLMHVETGHGEFHVKAGGLNIDDRPWFALKANGGFFQNKTRWDMPNIQGLILLCDAANGYPVAVMDSIEITIRRTGAATAVAAKYLARPDSEVCTIGGCGNQGRIQLQALMHVLPIRVVHAYSPDVPEMIAFSREMSKRWGIDVRPATDLEAALLKSDVCVTCTPSRNAFVPARAIRKGTFVAGVGADSPAKQELDPQLFVGNKVVGDLLDQCVAVGEIHHAIKAGLLTRADLHGEIGEIIAGQKVGRDSTDEITIYDSTGTALQDVAAAVAVYQAAISAGRGTMLSMAS